MVAVKSGNADAFLAKPDRLPDVILIFGEDSGLVSERVRALIGASVDDPDDPFSLVRLDGDEIAADPARLLDEAQTIPLFGGRRAVWVRAGGRNFAAALEAVLALPKSECRVVIEAGDLRRTAPLRAVCERAKNAAAVPCYPDNEAALERLIDGEMRAAGLSQRKVETLRDLFHGLLKLRIRPYYLYQCDPVLGTGHLRTTVAKGIELTVSFAQSRNEPFGTGSAGCKRSFRTRLQKPAAFWFLDFIFITSALACS